METITITVSEDEKKLLEQAAENHEMSVEEYVKAVAIYNTLSGGGEKH